MDRKESLLTYLKKSAQVSPQQELANSSKLISTTFVEFDPLLVSTTYKAENHKEIAVKIYAYAISCDGSKYYLYKDNYQSGRPVRSKFTASVTETLGFMRQSLSEILKQTNEVTNAAKPTEVGMG
jgi:hypothetical protein